MLITNTVKDKVFKIITNRGKLIRIKKNNKYVPGVEVTDLTILEIDKLKYYFDGSSHLGNWRTFNAVVVKEFMQCLKLN